MRQSPVPSPTRLPRAVWIVVLAFVALELSVSDRYGFHRDELYFIGCAHHLAWGYVDQPPLTPLLVRVSLLFGSSPATLRILPALAGAGVIVVAALFARELGAGRFGISFAALLTGAMPVLVGASHLNGTTPYDLLAWSIVLLLVTRAVGRDRPELWVAAGAVAGVGLLNKHTIATFLIPGLVVALLLSGQRRALASRWPWIGGVLALAIASPTLVWQATHGWPELTMMHALHANHSSSGDAAKFLPSQILYAGPIVVPIWIAGLVRLFRDETLAPFRFLAWLYVVLLVTLQVTTPGRPYYISALYLPLYAAGARWLEMRVRSSLRLPRRAWPWLIAVSVAPVAVIALPVLPIRAWRSEPPKNINYDLGEQIGWPHMVGQVAASYDGLPSTARADTTIVTSNYGEAGAIEHYGTHFGLPTAYSGHNSFWYWGPPPASRSNVLLVGFDTGSWRSWCSSLTPVGKLSNSQGVENDELGAPLTMCRGLRTSWARIWPALKHFN